MFKLLWSEFKIKFSHFWDRPVPIFSDVRFSYFALVQDKTNHVRFTGKCMLYSLCQRFPFLALLPVLDNRFLHTFLGKTGWSSTSNRNFMSFREWSAAKRHTNFYHERKITRAFPTTHVNTYFFRKPTTFTIANS